MSGLSFNEMIIWRKELKVQLQFAAQNSGYRIQVINPVDFYNFEENRHQSEDEIEDFDLAHVITSDIIVVNLDGLSSSDGTKLKYMMQIIITEYQLLHLVIKNCITIFIRGQKEILRE